MSTAATTVTRRTESHKARRRLNFRAGRPRVVSPRRKSELYWSLWSSDYYPRPACMLAAAPPVSPIVCTRVACRASVRCCTSNVGWWWASRHACCDGVRIYVYCTARLAPAPPAP